MPPTILEHDIQRAWCIWFGGEQWPDGSWKVRPAQLDGVMWWHTPNGGERRDAFEGKRLKQMGVKAGVHDILILWGGIRGLEFKRPGGVLSPAQKALHPRLLAAGMVASAVVDNVEDARRVCREWGLVAPGF